jgi:hypothetical protein
MARTASRRHHLRDQMPFEEVEWSETQDTSPPLVASSCAGQARARIRERAPQRLLRAQCRRVEQHRVGCRGEGASCALGVALVAPPAAARRAHGAAAPRGRGVGPRVN